MTISEIEEKYMKNLELCSTEELNLFNLLCSMLNYQSSTEETIISSEIVLNCLDTRNRLHLFVQHLEVSYPRPTKNA